MIRDIVIKTEERTMFLRALAVTLAIEYEIQHLPNRKEGKQNWLHKVRKDRNDLYNFAIYHTKTTIVVDIF